MATEEDIDITDNAIGCFLGLAIGDALGAPVEFRPRGTFEPVTGMSRGGAHGLPAGYWTDDTSMALCLAESLIESGAFDAQDQMRRYLRWLEEGYWSSTGGCFDIGYTTRAALGRFRVTGNPMSGSTDSDHAGNGSLMRLAPVPIYFRHDVELAVRMAGESSRTTHGAEECVDACRLFAWLLLRAFEAEDKSFRQVDPGTMPDRAPLSRRVEALARGTYADKTEDEIRGSGYVVDCLEASLWCFARSDSFAEAVLMAVNLGDDTDTTGAVCGQIAGAFYGVGGIPGEWREQLHRGGELEGMGMGLLET